MLVVDQAVQDVLKMLRKTQGYSPLQFPEMLILEASQKKCPIVSIDVECAASGPYWYEREPLQIGLATATQREGLPVSAPSGRAEGGARGGRAGQSLRDHAAAPPLPQPRDVIDRVCSEPCLG